MLSPIWLPESICSVQLSPVASFPVLFTSVITRISTLQISLSFASHCAVTRSTVSRYLSSQPCPVILSFKKYHFFKKPPPPELITCNDTPFVCAMLNHHTTLAGVRRGRGALQRNAHVEPTDRQLRRMQHPR